MHRISVLPVRDVRASRASSGAPGLGRHERSGEDAACLPVEGDVSVVLVARERFSARDGKPMVLHSSICCDSRADLDGRARGVVHRETGAA